MKNKLNRKYAVLALICFIVFQTAATAATTYHGNIKSKIFHTVTCRYYDCKNCTEVFETREAAIDRGYRPCKICKP